MQAEFRSVWPRTIALPLGLLFIPVLLSLVARGEWLVASVPVAIVIGFLVRPPRLWPIWIGSTLIVWASYGITWLFFRSAIGDTGGETIWTFMFETATFMLILVLVPLGFGRVIAQVIAK